SVSNGYGGTDTLQNIENVIGSTYSDTLMAGSGNDVFSGGPGQNTFAFTASAGHDLIRDFKPDTGGDTIQLVEVDPAQVTISAAPRLSGLDILFQAPDMSLQIEMLAGQQELGGGAISYQQPANYAVVGVGDFNGVGLDDVLYRDPNSGVTIVEYFNGLTETGGGV